MHKGMPPPPPLFVGGMSYHVMRTMHALGLEFSQRAQAAGMGRSWGMILGRLAYAGEGLTATDLRQGIGVSAASMSKTLADMEQEGLIHRIPNPEDARSMLVHLTETGRQRLNVFPEIAAGIEQVAFAGFTPEELDQLRAMLERIRRNLGDQAEQDCELEQREHDHVD